MTVREMLDQAHSLSYQERKQLVKLLIDTLDIQGGDSTVRGDSGIEHDEPHRKLRPMGLCEGDFRVPDDFDSPLPDAILREFEG